MNKDIAKMIIKFPVGMTGSGTGMNMLKTVKDTLIMIKIIVTVIGMTLIEMDIQVIQRTVVAIAT